MNTRVIIELMLNALKQKFTLQSIAENQPTVENSSLLPAQSTAVLFQEVFYVQNYVCH